MNVINRMTELGMPQSEVVEMTAAANGLVSADFEPCNNALPKRASGWRSTCCRRIRLYWLR